MDWSKGFSASYYMTIIDPRSWNDKSLLEVTGGNISRSGSGLRQSAQIYCPGYEPNAEKYIRIWLDVRQGGASDHVPLFTGLATSPTEQLDGTVRELPLDCYSILKGAEDIPLQRGWYAPAEANGAQLIKNMLNETIPAPVRIEGVSPNLTQHIIAEDDESHVSMIDKILAAIGWRLVISGFGEVTICEPAKAPAATLGRHYDVIESKIDIERDWFKCPNVFRATSGDLTAVARDDSETSQLSTAIRGREVWLTENDCNLNDGESIEEYAIRRLKEEQEKVVTLKYDRRFVPDVNISDIVLLDYPAQGLQGNYRVDSQTITLGHNATTSEEVSA